MPFGLGSSAFRVRVSVEIEDLVFGFESSTLGLELWLESTAFRLRVRVRVISVRIRMESTEG